MAPGVELKGSRVLCRNRHLTVRLDHVRDAATGAEVPDYLVVEPNRRRADLVAGVAVVPVLDGCIVLLRSFRHAVGATVIEVPRGFVDADEPPEDAALRELAEEAGLACAPDRLVPLGTCLPESGVIRARVALFAATECRADPAAARDAGEIGMGDTILVAVGDLPALLRAGTIEDATTALALHRYLDRG